MKYRVILDMECESERPLEEICTDLETCIGDIGLQIKPLKVKITGEELEYREIEI